MDKVVEEVERDFGRKIDIGVANAGEFQSFSRRQKIRGESEGYESLGFVWAWRYVSGRRSQLMSRYIHVETRP